MAGKSRGATALVGWLLLCAGIVGAITLFIVGQQRYESIIDSMAPAEVGCTTTLRFTDPGTFYVFEELIDSPSDTTDDGTTPDDASATGECVPTGTAGAEFGFEMNTGDRVVRTVRDRSVSYDANGRTGESYASFEVSAPTTVDIAVTSPDTLRRATIGRDPVAARDEMRTLGVILGVAGGVLGLLLLILTGWRSRRAMAAHTPDGPGWSRPTPPAPSMSGPAVTTGAQRGPQVPVNPHLPDHVVGTGPQAEPWAPPAVPSAPASPSLPPLPRRMAPPTVADDAGSSETAHHGDDTTVD